MVSEIITHNLEETKSLGENFAKQIKNGAIIALYGQLGSGKTTFTQGFAKGLGIKKRIISPSFVIVRTYKIKNKPQEIGDKNFYHIDLYRTESKKDIDGLGIEEILTDSENIVVIEWAEKLENLLPKKRIDINFIYIEHSKRKIIISQI